MEKKMKKIKWMAALFLVVSALLASGCSKYKLYTMAMDSRRNGADLEWKKTAISIGDIVYLDNAQANEDVDARETVLMVHGFGGNKDNWVLLSNKMTDDVRIVALDLPGHGESVSDPGLTYSIENQAKWLNEFMESLGIKKAHVMGNSMGGAIGLVLTRNHPEKVQSLALLDSAGVYVAKSELILQLEKGVNPLVAGNADEFKKLLGFVMEKKPYIPGFALSVMAEQKISRKTLDEKIFSDMRGDIVQPESALSAIGRPTLIVWGDRDRVIHIDNASEFHRKIKGSQLFVMNGIGHMPMLENPGKTWEVYKAFLESAGNQM
jgi:pimeloyl-ACP methyl ester carboxylesterase